MLTLLRLAVPLAATAAVSACTLMPRGMPPLDAVTKTEEPRVQSCADAERSCEVKVEVGFSGNGCTVKLPGRVEVYGRDRPVPVRWTLVPVSTDEFRFDGIYFPDASSRTEFTSPVVRDKLLEVSNQRSRASFGKAYHYQLNIAVRRADGYSFQNCGVDPVIVNKG